MTDMTDKEVAALAHKREYGADSLWHTRLFRVWAHDEEEFAGDFEVDAPCASDAAELYAEQLDSECSEPGWSPGGLRVFVRDVERGIVFTIQLSASVSWNADAIDGRRQADKVTP